MEYVESKVGELACSYRTLKDSIPPSSEHVAKDIKTLQTGLASFKADSAVQLGDLQRSIKAHNEL